VLSLDTLKALMADGAVASLRREIVRPLETAAASGDGSLGAPIAAAYSALEHALGWLGSHLGEASVVEAGARRAALTLGRTLELALLCGHAGWCHANGRGGYAAAAARRFARHGVDLIDDAGIVSDDSRLLVDG